MGGVEGLSYDVDDAGGEAVDGGVDGEVVGEEGVETYYSQTRRTG